MSQIQGQDRIVIIGAGHAGVQLSASLREGGFGGQIVIVSDDHDQPYHKPPLSKSFMLGPDAPLQPLKGAGFYTDKGIVTGRSPALGLAAASGATGRRRNPERGGPAYAVAPPDRRWPHPARQPAGLRRPRRAETGSVSVIPAQIGRAGRNVPTQGPKPI